MKTTVEIGDPLLEEAKKVARESGITLRDLIETGLQRVLEERRTKKPFVLRDCSVGHGSTPDPAMRWDDGHAMRMYCYMGRNGIPDTVEGVNEMLDEEAAEEAAADRGRKGT